jgi:uncharacterized protein (DUF433 family)
VVRQAVRQTYTYYSPAHPKGEAVEDAPLAGRGKAWTLGAYKHPTYPSPANVRVGDAGIKVWMVILWLQLSDNSLDELRRRYGDVLQREDVEAAKWYYQGHKEPIDQRLREEEEAGIG